MHRINRFIAYFLVCAMIAAFLPAGTHAVQHSAVLSNPTTAQVALEKAAAQLRQDLVARKGEISITYPADSGFDENDIWNAALSHTGNPKEGDYLYWQCNPAAWDIYKDAASKNNTVIYYPEYLTTADQESKLDTAVKDLLQQLNVGSASDFEKVKAVYNWMCQNITYDTSGSSTLKQSAYAALVNKKAVSQGYCALLYRLCLELGVDVRIVSGVHKNAAHNWNIVKLNGLYYNLDATLDANAVSTSWFLKGSATFADHTGDELYQSPDFRQQYPLSPNDYGVVVNWPVSGKCGTKLTWQLSKDGVLTISGSGAMPDYYQGSPEWSDYFWNIKSVVIGKNVTSIGAYAFYYSSALESVTISGSAAVKEAAFMYCGALKTISMPSITAIGDLGFMGCTSLASVQIGANVASIGVQVFNECPNLKTVTVDSGNTNFKATDNVLFTSDMKRLLCAGSGISKTYTLPSQVRELDAYAFSNCSALESITINEGVSILPEGLCYGCSALTTVKLPASVEEIGDYAFSGCSALTAMELPAELSRLGFCAFEDCLALSAIVFPQYLTAIDAYAFYNCAGLKSVKFTGDPPEIGDEAFAGVSAQAYYPGADCYKTWSHDKRSDYGGYLEWISFDAHNYEAKVTKPTCTEQGYTTYTCTHCEDAYISNYVAAAGHKWDSGKNTASPSGSTPGEITYTCSVCSGTRKEPVYSDHTHSYNTAVTAPGCTTQGYTTYTCKHCSYSYVHDYVAAADHAWANWVDKTPASCTENGSQRRDCEKCDHFQTRETSALGHKYTKYVSDGNASCVANATKTAQCDNGCGAADTVTDPNTMLEHTFGKWEVEAPATALEDGLERRDCSACGYYELRSIPALSGAGQVTSQIYKVGEDSISKIPLGTKASVFLQGIQEAEFVRLYKDGREVGQNTAVSTGMELRLISGGETVCTKTLVVTGDINGDGAISVTDMLTIKSHLLKKTSLAGYFLAAADTNGDGTVSITDFLQIKSHILKKSAVEPN